MVQIRSRLIFQWECEFKKGNLKIFNITSSMARSMIMAEITVGWSVSFCFVQLVPKHIFHIDFESGPENIIVLL